MRSLFRTAFPGLALALAALTVGCADLTPCERGAPGCGCRLDSQVSSTRPKCDPDDELGYPGVCLPDGICQQHDSATTAPVCYNACVWANNGICNDGGDGSVDAKCALGADCSDCGLRANPCPAADSSRPVMCPARFSSTDEYTCWPAGTACHTVTACTDGGQPFGCQNGEYVDCLDATSPGTCKAIPTIQSLQNYCVSTAVRDGTRSPQLCGLGTSLITCNPPLTDCREREICGTNTGASTCFTGEQLTCNGNVGTCATTIQ